MLHIRYQLFYKAEIGINRSDCQRLDIGYVDDLKGLVQLFAAK